MSENKSKKFIYHFFSKLLVVSLSVFLLGYYIHTYAIVSPYQPGQTLDPACTPTDTNCYVQILPDQTGNSGKFLTTDGSVTSWASVAGGSYTFSSGLTDTSGTITNNLTTGLAGGQELRGGTGAGEKLTLMSTLNATKGKIQFGTSGAFDEANVRFGIGTISPSSRLDIITNTLGTTQTSTSGVALVNNTAASLNAQQISPAIRWTGQGWKTSAGGASQTVDWQADILPVRGSANPSSVWRLKAQSNGGGYTDILQVDSSGNIFASSPSSSFNADSFNATYGIFLTNSTSVISLNSDVGTAGQVLTSAGPGVTPTWTTLSGAFIGSTSVIGNETWLGTDTATMGTACDINSTFIGTNAGLNQAGGCGGTMIGLDAGSGGGGPNSTFVGREAGMNADDALNVIMIGYQSGKLSASTAGSIFIGSGSGGLVGTAQYSNFIGAGAGYNSSNSSHSIYIGRNAGQNQTVNNTGDINDYNILIGNVTSAGGNNNSIAIGEAATNTASNQLMIGSTTRSIEEMVITGAAQTCTIRPDTAGINCTSDERLKTNISDLSPTLDLLKNIRTVNYNWSSNPNANPQIGFLAQNLKESFPTLVSTAPNGYYQVNYAGMAPILVNSIKELNLKIEGINNLEKENTFRDVLIAWFANAANHLTRIFTGEVCLTDPDGTSECINKSELHQLKQLLNTQTPPPNPDPIPTPDPTPDPIPLPPQDPVVPDQNPELTPNQDPTPSDTPPSDTPAPAN
jgi:hypothetical protein